MELRLGEDRPVKLSGPGEWDHSVEGMASAVRVQKLWRSRPYPDDEGREGPPGDMVFMVRGRNPGEALLRFRSSMGETHDVRVTVRR